MRDLARADGDAGGQLDGDLEPVEVDRLADQHTHGLGEGRQGLGVVLRQHERELVAAEPRRQHVGREGLPQPAGHALQQAVAGRVAEAVVDLLEAVEIEHDDREGPRRREPVGDLADHGPAVGQAGELVRAREPARLGGAARLAQREHEQRTGGQEGRHARTTT